MYTDDGQVDGSWNLKVKIIDVDEDVCLRVTGDKSIGSVMYMLVEAIPEKRNWSDHGLWWPARKKWLLHTRSTLDQCAVAADSELLFVRMHNLIKVRLPDLQVREMRVNFASKVFGVVVQLCQELGIRHPEELSLSRPFTAEELKLEKLPPARPLPIRKSAPGPVLSTLRPNGNGPGSASPLLLSPSRFATSSPFTPSTPNSPQLLSPNYSPQTLGKGTQPNGGGSANTLMPASVNSLRFEGMEESGLAHTPQISTEEALVSGKIVRLKNLVQRARINGSWLDSSRSLMEQNITPNEDSQLCLRFKFFSFYDLNPKYDAIRINQIFEHAKWSLISEEVECNEEEMIVFAALQLQAQLQWSAEVEMGTRSLSSAPSSPRSPPAGASGDTVDGPFRQSVPEAKQKPQEQPQGEEMDEVDSALAELQLQLEGGDITASPTKPASPLRSPGAKDSTDGPAAEVLEVPRLSDYLKFFKPRKFSIKSYKRMWVVLMETSISLYRYHKDAGSAPLERFHLLRSEVQMDVNVTTNKFGLRIFLAGADQMQEIWLRCESKEQFANWFAACRLASMGKTLASQSQYKQERETCLNFLEMQTPSPQPVLTRDSMPDINVADFVSRFVMKKLKQKALLHRVAEAHSKIRHLGSLEAKRHYIKNWQQLSNYGVNRFVVRFKNAKKDEVFGISDSRLVRLEASSGDLLKVWRLRDIQQWNVNWNTEMVHLQYKGEELIFHPLSCDCKTVHEFVGGYIFMNMRSPEKNQELNEAFFHKLTGGNHPA